MSKDHYGFWNWATDNGFGIFLVVVILINCLPDIIKAFK